MISTIGNLSLCAAILASAGTILAAVGVVRFGSTRCMRLARGGIGVVALCFTGASIALITALLTSDFRFEYVADYTERALPWGYKLAAFWAGQEGSLLLWAWMLAIISFIAVLGFRRLERTDEAVAVATLGLVCGFFGALMLFAANPFVTFAQLLPPDGRGLNPMLQDPGMIIHPPLLFLGYAGFTVPFAVLVGVLVAGRRDNHWIAAMRRWLLASWLFLTAGIVLGAWWAYVELGWGGYWAWDPVENASLLPWLTATALLHATIVQQHRGMFKGWTAVLTALTFILCIFGSYLTRSGVIQSVHAFAPSMIATFFLVFLLLCTVGSAALIAWRRKALRSEHVIEGLVSREGAFLLSIVLLLIMTLTTLVGTTFPLISGVFIDEAITVGAPFYNRVVAPMGVALVALMALGPVLAFGRSAASRIARSLVVPGGAALLATAIVAYFNTLNPWALVCVAITTLGTFTVIVDFARTVSARRRSTGENHAAAAVRLVDRDHRRYGGQIAHLGMMMMVIGIAGSSLFGREEIFRLRPGDTFTVGDRTMTFVSFERVREVNFTAFQATVQWQGSDDAALTPQTRFYDTWEQPNTEVAVRSSWREDVYVSLAGWENNGQLVTLQVRVTPLVLWIWIGGIVMTAGGLFCMLPPLLPRALRARVAGTASARRPKREPEPALEPALAAPRVDAPPRRRARS